MAPCIQRLAVTPRPKEDESLPSYLLRLVEANGLKAPSWLCVRLRGGALRQRVSVNFNVSQLSYISGWPPDALTMFDLEGSDAGETCAVTTVRGVNGRRGTRNLLAPMFCPLCVEEFGYIAKYWDAESVVACPLHGVYGVTHCRKCGEMLSWERSRLRYCSCGARISDVAKLSPADEIDIALAELVASAASGYYGPGVAGKLGFPVQVLQVQTPAVLLRILEILARFVEGVKGNDIYGPAARISYRSALEVLRFWPKSFKTFIKKAVARGQQLEVHRLLFHHGSGIFSKYNKERRDLVECLDMLADAVYETINEGEPWVIDRRVRETVFKGRQFRWMTATEYAHSLGVATRRLKKLEIDGQISLSSFKWGATKAKSLVVQTGVEVENSLLRVKLRDAAKRLELSVGIVRAILERRWFSSVGVYTGHGVTARAFMALEVGLNDIARNQRKSGRIKVESVDGMKRFGDVLKSSRIKLSAKLQLIDRARSGSLDATGPAERLIDLVIDTSRFGDEMSAHARGGGESGWVFAKDVAGMLQCSPKTVKALIKARHLSRLNGFRRVERVPLSSIYRFQRKFVSCRELAQLLGTTTRGVRNRMLTAFPKTQLLYLGRRHTPFLSRKGLPDPEHMCEVLLQE